MKICLSGYYGFDNAGDEALLSAITSTIRLIEPDTRFTVFSGYPGKTAELHGLRAVNRINPRSIVRELLDCDLLISGGGSLFQDVTGPLSLPYYIGIVALAKMLKKPVIFYAQGIGPINRSYSKILMRLVANQVDIITLRDEDSRNTLLDMGVNIPPMKVTADPVFNLEPSPQEFQDMIRLFNSLNPEKQKTVGVSVRSWNPLKKQRQNMADFLDILAQNGFKIMFLPLDYPGDVAEARQISSLMTFPAVIIDRHITSQEHIALISNFDLMVGMRLHSLIFAAGREIPFAGISYDPKIDAFLKLFGLMPLAGDPHSMFSQVSMLLQDKAGQEKIKQKSRELKQKAKETAHLALSLCRKQF